MPVGAGTLALEAARAGREQEPCSRSPPPREVRQLTRRRMDRFGRPQSTAGSLPPDRAFGDNLCIADICAGDLLASI
jgi:hypothetical protein